MTDYRKWNRLASEESDEESEVVRTRIDTIAHELHENLNDSIVWMRDKEIILLGENTHGTLDYYEYRCQVTRQLIQEGVVKSVCIEADW